jgi:3-oxoacyl-[acyl-carrier-protein] synthase-3
MPITSINAPVLRAVTSCVPSQKFDNTAENAEFTKEEVDKVVRMAGVKMRHLADDATCSSDLCLAAAKDVLEGLNWSADSVDAVIMVTQSPDYFLPSTACLIHRDLGLRDGCAAFDVGLGCSGYPYGIWLASMMLQTPGFRRALVLHGETPSKFTEKSDRSVALLFGDAGSATALESKPHPDESKWWFSLNTDGKGYGDLIMEGGGFRNRFPEDPIKYCVRMNGANVFNFTIKRVPPLIEETLSGAGMSRDEIDYFVFHQSNRFIMRHLAKKAGIPEEKIPVTIDRFGSTGGPSVPLTLTQGAMVRPVDRPLNLLLLGYGVGLSWGSALMDMPPQTRLNHISI